MHQITTSKSSCALLIKHNSSTYEANVFFFFKVTTYTSYSSALQSRLPSRFCDESLRLCVLEAWNGHLDSHSLDSRCNFWLRVVTELLSCNTQWHRQDHLIRLLTPHSISPPLKSEHRYDKNLPRSISAGEQALFVALGACLTHRGALSTLPPSEAVQDARSNHPPTPGASTAFLPPPLHIFLHTRSLFLHPSASNRHTPFLRPPAPSPSQKPSVGPEPLPSPSPPLPLSPPFGLPIYPLRKQSHHNQLPVRSQVR